MATKQEIALILEGLQEYGMVGEYDDTIEPMSNGEYYWVDDVCRLIGDLIDKGRLA